MNNALERIGFLYEKMPSDIRVKYFSHIKGGQQTEITIDGEDEKRFIAYLNERVKKDYDADFLINDFMRFFSNYAILCNGGKKFIKIADERLKEDIFHTDIGNMLLNDLNLPFDTFYIELDLEYHFGTERKHTIEGALIQNFSDWVLIDAMEIDKSNDMPSLIYFTIFKNTPIKDQIERIAKDFFDSTYSKFFHNKARSSLEEKDRGLVSQIVKLFSALFYLDHAQRELKSSISEINEWKPYSFKTVKSSTTEFNAKRLKAYHYILLHNPDAKAKTISTHSISHSKQNKMTLVRGHWRRQQIGQRNVEKQFKTIWIKPFWKNIDYDLDANTHIYTIKSPLQL